MLDHNRRPVEILVRERRASSSNWRYPSVSTWLDSQALQEIVTEARTKYPNLRTILNDHPFHPQDYPYALHIQGEDITMAMETYTSLDLDRVNCPPFTSSNPTPLLPASKSFSGLTVRQTFELSIRYGYDVKKVDDWIEWVFCGTDLDKRVTGIRFDHWRVDALLSLNDLKNFLLIRKANGCEPLRTFTIPHIDSISITHLEAILKLLGKHLRILTIPESITRVIQDWQALIRLIDRYTPLLEILKMSIDVSDTSPFPPRDFANLLPNLRCFKFRILTGRHPPWFVRYLAGIGSRDCA